MLQTKAKMTTHPMGAKKPAMRPSTMISGRNAAMVVRTPKMTGTETSQVPSTAAVSGDFPSCSWPNTRSPTTMASSTTIPRTKMKAITVIVDMVISVKGSTARVPSRATGMPMATHMATRNFRNSANITNTRIRPPPAFLVRTDIRSCSSKEVSIHVLSEMPSGISF